MDSDRLSGRSSFFGSYPIDSHYHWSDNADRAVALDTMGINLMAFAGLTAIHLVTTKLNDVILLIGILLFIGTIAIAKFIEKGVIIDRNNH